LPLEKFRNKNICLVSHTDLDGIGSIIVYKYYIELIAKSSLIISCDYSDIEQFEIDNFKQYDLFCFTDITPTQVFYEKLIEMNKEVYVYDHHQSAYNTLLNIIKEEDYYYSTEKCGTQIFFEELTKGKRTSKCVHQFCELVNTYDTWQEQSALWKDGKALHNILWGSMNWSAINTLDKYDKFINNQLEKFHKGKNFYLTAYEMKLALAAEDKERELYIKAKNNLTIRKDGEGNNYAYFEAASKISIIANRLLKDFSELKYICGHGTFNDKEGIFEPSISLRSLGEVDVSIIASLYNGGGHARSSGLLLEYYDLFLQFRDGKKHLI
jgi:oligoribonuclease NrnB/cAMP/cGMP phosphodiesterase (DHH superfamily)